jgi:hypothetical protein
MSEDILFSFEDMFVCQKFGYSCSTYKLLSIYLEDILTCS